MARKKKKNDQPEAAANDPAVASEESNARLQHTDELRNQAEVPGPAARSDGVDEGRSATTRDDRADLGVPMVAGSPDEPVGPEDALGPGEKRGDYRKRIVGDPHSGAEPQRPHAEKIGDGEGKKGGVETA